MGLLKGLVLLPLAPVEGVAWLARQLQEEAERQLHDPDAILAELAEYQRAVDSGAISDEEYLAVEEELLDRLEEAEAYMEERSR